MKGQIFLMAGLNAPCMTCPDKGCGAYHGQCEKYKKFREEVQKRKELIKKSNIYVKNVD